MTPTIVIHERIDLPAGPDEAWNLIKQPDTLVPCLPGAQIRSVEPDGTILGTISLSLGPTTTTFQGRLTLTFDDVDRTGVMHGKGADGRGRTQAVIDSTFRLLVSEAVAGSTPLEIDSTVAVNGALAGFAAAGGKALAQRLLRDFAANLAALPAMSHGGTNDSADASVDAGERPKGAGDAGEYSGAAAPVRPVRVVSLVFRSLWDAISRLWPRNRKVDGRQAGRGSS